jgi:hypothetical protein
MPSEGRGGLSDADVQRIAAQLAGRLHGQGGKGDRAPLLPTVRRGGKGKSKGRGQTGGGGGEGKGGNERGTTWRCSSCGEPRNFAHREECFRCYAPRRPEPHRQPAHRPTAPRPKPDGKDARGSLSAPHSGPLRPNVSRAYQGPVGADGQRPLFKRYLEDEARKKQRQGTEAAGGDDSKGADDGDDGFLLLSRAAGVWPRVGGTDKGRGRGNSGQNSLQAQAATDAHGAEGGAPTLDDRPTDKPATSLERKAPATAASASSPPPITSSRMPRKMPSRPSWADQGDEDMELLSEDFWADPEAEGDDDHLHHPHEHREHHEHHDGDGWDEDGADECEDEADAEVLRERWISRRDILDAVKAKFGKGQPQYDTARREATAAYEAWQEAKRAENAPRLATLHQRRQRSLDHARKMLQRDMDAAEKELERHDAAMADIRERIGNRQRKVDEAQERLQEVMQKVGDAAAEGGDGSANIADGRHGGTLSEVRGRARDARQNIIQAGSKLQLVLDMLDSEGHHEACQHLSFLFGSITDAAADLDDVERMASGTTHHAMDADDVIDESPPGENKPPRSAQTPKRGADGATLDDKTGKKAKGSGGKGSRTRVSGASNADDAGDVNANAAGTGQATPGAEAAATAPAAVAAPSSPPEIYYAGTTSLDEEETALRDAASKAVQQSIQHFANAPKGKDTDDAALLHAHQLVLASVGTPTNGVELRAFERWRAALGTMVVAEAAARVSAASGSSVGDAATDPSK